MGGGIALRFALLYPKRASALIVSNSASAAGTPLSHDDLIMRAQSIKIILEEGPDAMADFAMSANPNTKTRLELNPDAKAEIYDKYRMLSPIGYANSLRALLAMDYVGDRLHTIRVPTLLIGGDRDPSLAAMRKMRKSIRGSKLVVLEDASHFANRDQPAAWTRTVLELVASLARRSR
jgi:3-oxoadipate enol-lactonase